MVVKRHLVNSQANKQHLIAHFCFASWFSELVKLWENVFYELIELLQPGNLFYWLKLLSNMCRVTDCVLASKLTSMA